MYVHRNNVIVLLTAFSSLNNHIFIVRIFFVLPNVSHCFFKHTKCMPIHFRSLKELTTKFHSEIGMPKYHVATASTATRPIHRAWQPCLCIAADSGRHVGLLGLHVLHVDVVAVYRRSHRGFTPPPHLPPHLISGKSIRTFSTKQQDFLLFAIQSLEQNLSLDVSS